MFNFIRAFFSINKDERYYIEVFNRNYKYINQLSEYADGVSDPKKYFILDYIVNLLEKKNYINSINGLKRCGYENEKELLDHFFNSCDEASFYVYSSIDRNVEYSLTTLATSYRLNYGDKFDIMIQKDVSLEMKKYIKNLEFD